MRWIAVVSVAFGIASAFAGNVVEYTYDTAGNITNISRPGASTVAITGFNPTSGPVGTTVTISGTGFSATPANNAVTFNGTAANVSASSAISITTAVPTGATTGPISVTVGASTGASSTSFTVAPGAPTITGFTPASGALGTSVSVTGTNFNVSATTVALNGVTASASIGSTTALTFTVPTSASSGRITATTSVGTGASTTDFIVPPPGLTVASIEKWIRISANGGYSNVATTTVGKSALVLFDGTAAAYYSLQFGTLTTDPIAATLYYTILRPDNSVLASGTLTTSSVPTLHLAPLPATGTYTLQLTPSGNTLLNTNVRLDADPAITVDGSAVSIAQDMPAQSTRYTFTASSGQRIGLGLTGAVTTPSGHNVAVNVHTSGGSTLVSGNCGSQTSQNPPGNCGVDILAPSSGTYDVTIDSDTATMTSTTLQLTSDASGTLSPDVGQAVTLTRAGQSATYSFTVSSGDSFGIDLSAMSITQQATLNVTILKPDGSQLSSCAGNQASSLYCELGTLSTAGTYKVHARVTNGNYGTFTLTLKQGPLIGTTDSPVSFATANVNETTRVRFTATAGQYLGAGLTTLGYVGSSSNYSQLYIFNPSASNIASANCYPTINSGDCAALAKNAAAGTYSAVVVPASGVKISGNLEVSAYLTGTLTAGTGVSLNATRPGQGAFYTFSGTAGDNIAIKLFSVTSSPASQNLFIELDRSDTSYLNSGTASPSQAGVVPDSSLPVTGTYNVVVTPGAGYPWTATLELDPGALLTLNGSTATLTNSAAGEPVRYRFNATSGQELDFGLTGLTYGAGSGSTTIVVTTPTGGAFGGFGCDTSGNGNCDAIIQNLTTGTYSILLSPPNNVTFSGGTVTLSTPTTGTFVVGDPAQVVAVTRGGQTARYTFSGTAGQLLHLNWSSTSISGGTSVAVTVLNPSGGTVSSSSFPDSSTGGFDIASLPSTGIYTVVFDPATAATMSATVSLVTR